MTTATCHGGAVPITLARPPAEATEGNCSPCRRYGVLWACYPAADVATAGGPTDRYAWNGRQVGCYRCGGVTHWWPREESRDRRGINARLLPPETLATARLRHLDGAGKEDYVD